jgi:cysteine desulfurase
MAMAEAAKICSTKREKETARLKRLAEKLNEGIKKISAEISLVANESKKIDHIMLFHIPGVYGEEICYLLDKENIEVSTGSACAAGAREPSHVLLAMGWARREARQVIRVSLGRTNTEEEIDRFLFSFQKVLESFPQFSS